MPEWERPVPFQNLRSEKKTATKRTEKSVPIAPCVHVDTCRLDETNYIESYDYLPENCVYMLHVKLIALLAGTVTNN